MTQNRKNDIFNEGRWSYKYHESCAYPAGSPEWIVWQQGVDFERQKEL